MLRYILKRLALAVVTLFLLSVIVFALSQMLPGNVARAVLGQFATQEAIDSLNHQIGADRPAVIQYLDYMRGFVQGDLGVSLASQTPVWSILEPALINSLKLAALAFVIVVPLSILGGIVAGLRTGTLGDRTITIFGLSMSAIPEFVTGIILILVFVIWLGWLPVTAQWDEGAGPVTQMKHLLLPSLCLALVLFGYIARITRAGVIEAADADYTRTAYLKGLPTHTVIRRHVLRNALLPTIAVVATQTSYLVGGLLIVEGLFNYQGIGLQVYLSAQQNDFTVLTSAVLVLGLIVLFVTLIADILYGLLNPRIRFGTAE
ncbi:MAG: ABC transporter permease [Actinobacteria bacterium]|nr:ABC transporter permease [Actinomycetota bacterium]